MKMEENTSEIKVNRQANDSVHMSRAFCVLSGSSTCLDPVASQSTWCWLVQE